MSGFVFLTPTHVTRRTRVRFLRWLSCPTLVWVVCFPPLCQLRQLANPWVAAGSFVKPWCQLCQHKILFSPRDYFFFFGMLISSAILHFLIRMDMEIVVLLQLAAGSMQWHEAGHGVGSGGKGESLAGGAASRC